MALIWTRKTCSRKVIHFSLSAVTIPMTATPWSTGRTTSRMNQHPVGLQVSLNNYVDMILPFLDHPHYYFRIFYLILPSSLSVYSSAPKTKIIFQFLRRILEGRLNRARPSQPILKNCQNGTLLPLDEILNSLGPNDFIWSAMKVPFCDFVQNVPQTLFMCISMWIKVNKWNYLKTPSCPHRNSFFLF